MSFQRGNISVPWSVWMDGNRLAKREDTCWENAERAPFPAIISKILRNLEACLNLDCKTALFLANAHEPIENHWRMISVLKERGPHFRHLIWTFYKSCFDMKLIIPRIYTCILSLFQWGILYWAETGWLDIDKRDFFGINYWVYHE